VVAEYFEGITHFYDLNRLSNLLLGEKRLRERGLPPGDEKFLSCERADRRKTSGTGGCVYHLEGGTNYGQKNALQRGRQRLHQGGEEGNASKARKNDRFTGGEN